MAIVVSGISLPFEEAPEQAVERALKRLGNPAGAEGLLVKKSVDARRKGQIQFVYSVAVRLGEGERQLAQRLSDPHISYKEEQELVIATGSRFLPAPPVVVGLGPAGLFAALLLARQGLRPVVLERGGPVEERVARVEAFWKRGELDPCTNVQFGEGGAGTFSDGKLTTRIGDSRTGFVLRELARHGAPGEILYQAKPHVGTDRLREIVRSMRQEIITLGGEVRFYTCCRDLLLQNGKVTGVRTGEGDIPAQAVIFAPGHSARDTFAMLEKKGVRMEAKPFSVGVRIEHLQEDIDRGLYGKHAGNPLLPRGEYQLSHRQDGRGVYTFCMCPGGIVVPAASQEGGVVTNGMSYQARAGRNANSALVVSVTQADFGASPLAGIAFQQELEERAYRMSRPDYAAPAQTAGRFLEGKKGFTLKEIQPTYTLGIKEGDFDSLFPPAITDMLRTGLGKLGRKLPGFDRPDALLTGVETRTSSPVRLTREDSLEACGIQGLYPCGEGAGYAGGIVSAAVDGLRCAQAVLAKYKGLKG